MIIIRIWHQKLLPYLPRQQLLGQHRECCALRGKGWGKKHAIVDYVFTHLPAALVAYHYLVMDEMKRRGYSPDEIWRNPDFRGNTLGLQENWSHKEAVKNYIASTLISEEPVYPEHDDAYLQECLDNLAAKGILIDFNKKI